MKNDALSRTGDRISDWLDGQAWFQSLKGKWEELDPESRKNLRVVGLVAAVAVGLGSVYWAGSGTAELREKIEAKKDLLSLLEKGGDELRRLRANPRLATRSSERVSWGQYGLETAAQSGVDRGSLEALPEKPGNKTTLLQETEFGLRAKSITVRQLLRLVYGMENGREAVRVGTLSVKTVGNEGYLEAELGLTGTSLLERK